MLERAFEILFVLAVVVPPAVVVVGALALATLRRPKTADAASPDHVHAAA